MKKFILTTALFLVAANASANIKSFDNLKKAVFTGHSVSARINFDKCQFESKLAKDSEPTLAGVMKFNEISYYKPADEDTSVVAASITHFTVHHAFGPVKQFLRMRVTPENKAKMYSAIIDPTTNEIKQAKHFTCDLGKGIDFRKIH